MICPLYDLIGKQYSLHRRADSRIVNAIKDLLNVPEGSTIADIGAGTGNYSNALADKGFRVIAIEPSCMMMNQAVKNSNVEWMEGVAENIPLPDESVDAVVSVLANHHFSSDEKALAEINRICPKGPVVWFTFDPREAHNVWFAEYFPEIWADAHRIFPPIDDLVNLFTKFTGNPTAADVFKLPHDLKDKFMAAYWREPEAYLNEEVRQATSGFALADPDHIKRGVETLEKDLNDGTWMRKYGQVLELNSIDWGYRFIVSEPDKKS
jgi:ubiquinone/menaquinone biosynthesis C-methylase UbiE